MQTEGWALTRQRVVKAATSVLGVAADITFEALVISVEVLKLVPNSSLTGAAKTLVIIWEAYQLVDTNRQACLRLTERCAEALLSIHEEVKEAGDDVGEELIRPIAKLNEAFNKVHTFLQKQIQRPFLDRYLKRDEILLQIAECDASLRDALSMFSLSIQIRILKHLQQASRPSIQYTGAAKISSSESMDTLVASDCQIDTATEKKPDDQSHLHANDGITIQVPSTESLTPSSIVPTLQSLQSLQNTSDTAQDMTDLRSLMKTALQKTSDVEMMEVLQVGREEMPEAIRMLQRALECVVQKEVTAADMWGDGRGTNGEMEGGDWDWDWGLGGDSGRSGMGFSVELSGSTGTGWRMDTLDREFIETGLDALRRMSKGPETTKTSPAWFTAGYEVDWYQRHQGYLDL